MQSSQEMGQAYHTAPGPTYSMLSKSLTLSFQHFFWLRQKWVYQIVESHTGLTHHFQFFDIQALWRSVLSARVPECQKIKNGGLDQYGPEHYEV